MKRLLKIVPWLLLALFATEIVAVMMPKQDGEMHVKEFGRLPVLLNGRIQPFDSAARNSLLQIRSTGDVPLEFVTNHLGRVEEWPGWKFWHHPKKLKSTEWLLEVMFKPEIADARPIFLIHHPDLISELKLGDKGVENSGLRYYTFKEIEPIADEISKQGQQAQQIEDASRTTYQKQVLKLANAVLLYQRLKNSIGPEGVADLTGLIDAYKASLPAGIAAFQAQQAGQTADKDALEKFARLAQAFQAVANLADPMIIPPSDPQANPNGWVNMGTSLIGSIQSGEIDPVATFYARMATAYSRSDATEFNSAVAGYKNWLAPKFGHEVVKARAEFYFNQIKIFLHATIIYIFAFVLAAGALLTFAAWPQFSESFRRAAFYLIVLAFAAHTFGLIYRMVLEGRPPVTNLYSSAVFIGWGACVYGMGLERFYKNALGCVVAALAGFITLIIAHNLVIVQDNKDTMEMMRAVLDTNFWLATHVVTVTLGYASTFVAGLLAIMYVLLGVFTRNLTAPMSPIASQAAGIAVGSVVKTGGSHAKTAIDVTAAAQKGELGKALAKMVYAIVCFATLFSFVGTVLGGIWADQSWGRFWGWDPKENGALLIVLWNAIILHARWGGLVRERGLMNLAIFGNIVTSFSWFGVNMLGIGLHNYGFMDAVFKWLVFFVGTQLTLIMLGSLPLNMWKSFQKSPTAGSSSENAGAPKAVTS